MAGVPGVTTPNFTPADANAQVNETAGHNPPAGAEVAPFNDGFHVTHPTGAHEATAKGQAHAGDGEVSASNDFNREASVASGQVKGKLGNADLSAHAELGHVQFSESASFKASAKDMSIDGNLKVHVDASLIKAGATISGDIPVKVNNETLHVKYLLNLQGAVGINGDLNLGIHVGADGARVTAQASGNVANASVTGRVEIDDDEKRELAGGQLSLGVAAGVQFAAGGGGGLTRLTGKDADPNAGNWKKGGIWSWGLNFNGKLALGPASGSWSMEVNAFNIGRDIPKMISP
jgi:hypothetical protein